MDRTHHTCARAGAALWQGRFASCILDDAHLLAAARYVERNQVRAGLCAAGQEWPWSSARSHLDDRADGLTGRRPLLALIVDWADFLAADDDQAVYQRLRAGHAEQAAAG